MSGVSKAIVQPLLDWYDAGHRDLPWRSEPAPYRVWVSEIMLQQTRVEAVRGYVSRWMNALPDIPALAAADEAVYTKLWEGLGYYSRVRNLHRAAVLLCEEYGGELPADYDRLLALPGVGEYTAGAVASIAFGLPVPAVDGNVLRVAARLDNDFTPITDAKFKKQTRERFAALMPSDRPGDLNQSLMELGATVCLPNGLENSLFQLGRVLVVSMISLFGTTQITANALANNLDAVAVIPGQAMSLAMITVIGQCIGSGDEPQTRRMAKKLMVITYAVTASTCLVTIACTPLILKIYSVSAEALALGMTLIMIHNGCAIFLWPTSFAMPNILRAANDVRYPMVCSIISMLGLRLVAGYILAVHFGMGAIGIWIAMIGDWLCRSICFFLRLKSGKWLRYAPGLRVAAGQK